MRPALSSEMLQPNTLCTREGLAHMTFDLGRRDAVSGVALYGILACPLRHSIYRSTVGGQRHLQGVVVDAVAVEVNTVLDYGEPTHVPGHLGRHTDRPRVVDPYLVIGNRGRRNHKKEPRPEGRSGKTRTLRICPRRFLRQLSFDEYGAPRRSLPL
jgi:hypothetical protein